MGRTLGQRWTAAAQLIDWPFTEPSSNVSAKHLTLSGTIILMQFLHLHTSNATNLRSSLALVLALAPSSVGRNVLVHWAGASLHFLSDVGGGNRW